MDTKSLRVWDLVIMRSQGADITHPLLDHTSTLSISGSLLLNKSMRTGAHCSKKLIWMNLAEISHENKPSALVQGPDMELRPDLPWDFGPSPAHADAVYQAENEQPGWAPPVPSILAPCIFPCPLTPSRFLPGKRGLPKLPGRDLARKHRSPPCLSSERMSLLFLCKA